MGQNKTGALGPGESDPGTSGYVELKLVEQLYEWADALETKLNVASENGLFQHQPGVYQTILEKTMFTIEESVSHNSKLSRSQYRLALQSLDEAKHLYDSALQGVSRWKKLSCIYGVPSLIYLLAVFATLITLLGLLFPSQANQTSTNSTATNVKTLLAVPAPVILAGSLGAVLRGIWALWWDVNRMKYRKVWETWYILAPFMGALLGLVVYLAFYTGIVATTAKPDIANLTLAYLIAFVAGFNWDASHKVLEKVASILTGESKSATQ